MTGDIFDEDDYLDEDINQDYVTTDTELVDDDELGNLDSAIEATPKQPEQKQRKKIQKDKNLPAKLKAKGIKCMVLVMSDGRKVIYA